MTWHIPPCLKNAGFLIAQSPEKFRAVVWIDSIERRGNF
jgi:hypothetical protein